MAITLDGTNGINSSGVIVAPDGSASAPSITNDGDTNTGIYFPAADNIAIATGGTARLNIDGSGCVTTPYQPAFRAGATGASNVTTQDIPFTNVSTELCFNRGSHFNTSTLRFTAPVAGVYLFYTQAYTENSISYLRYYINGSGYMYTYKTDTTADITISSSVLLNLNANDYVQVKWLGSGVYYSAEKETYFQGQLVG